MTKRFSRGVTASDGIDPDLFFSESREKKNRRKDYQLCGQVQRAVSSALSADFDDEILNELWVAKVEPAPTVSRLLIWVAGPPNVDASLIIERLERVKSALRAEVAGAIHRRRVPHLLFAIYRSEVDE